MEIVSVKDLVWVREDHSIFNATVEFAELPGEEVRLAASADDSEPHGQEIWRNGIAGEYGPIADYIAPVLTPEEKRARMPILAKWRVDTVIDLEPGLREKINAAIERMAEPKRTISKNKLASVTEFSRLDSLFDDIGSDPDVGKTPDDIDLMWLAGAALA